MKNLKLKPNETHTANNNRSHGAGGEWFCFVVHASTQNERSKAKAANVHVASSTFIATVKKDLKYIN